MKVSIIIPCFNAEGYVAQTIGSVLEQTRPAEEVILVDDGSTDRSLEIARRFGPRVRILAKDNEGAQRARNDGFALASGDALMFLDADDVLGPTALEELTATLREHPESIAICPWYRLELIDGTWVRQPPSCEPRRSEQDDLRAWLSHWYQPPCSVLWSRQAYERTGGWDERVVVNQDGDIMMRALVDGVALSQAPGGAAFYRREPPSEGSLSDRRYSRAGIESEVFVYAKIAYLLEKRGRLAEYRTQLGQAFDDLAGAARDHYPELFTTCKEYARRYDKPRAVRAARRRIKQAAGRAGAALSDGESFQSEDAPIASNHEEVRHGLETARRAANTAGGAEAPSAPQLSLDRPLVSVVIPTYNRARMLERAVKSVVAQSFSDFEILVIDDGSTDDTTDVVAGLEDSRLRYILQGENRGVAAARNRGLREARGAYVAFLDSDDEWVPGKLERQIERFETLSDDVGLLYCGAEIIEDDGSVSRFRPRHRGRTFESLLVGNVIHASSGVVIRRNVVPTLGYFDEAMPAIEDYDYWLRIARFYEFEFVEEPLFRYFHHGSSLRKTAEIEKNLEAYEYLFAKHWQDMHWAGVSHLYLKESADRHLINGRSDLKGVRPLARRAVRWNPLAYESYRFLLRTHLSESYFRFLRDTYQGVRQHVSRMVPSRS